MTTQNARQRADNQDFELELDNEKITRQRRKEQKDKHFKHGPKLWIKEPKIIG